MTQNEIDQKMLIWLQKNLPKQMENSKFWRLTKIPSLVDFFVLLSINKAENSQVLPVIIPNSNTNFETKIINSSPKNSNPNDAKNTSESNSYNTIIPKSVPKNSPNKKLHRSEPKVEIIGANYDQKLNISPKSSENETKNSQNSKITLHKISNPKTILPKKIENIINFTKFPSLINSKKIVEADFPKIVVYKVENYQNSNQKTLISISKVEQKAEDISKNSSTIIQNTTILKSKIANSKISPNPKIIQIDQIKEVLETVNSKIKLKDELKSKTTSSNAQTNQKLWQKLQKLKIPNLPQIATSIPTKIDFGKSYQKVAGL